MRRSALLLFFCAAVFIFAGCGSGGGGGSSKSGRYVTIEADGAEVQKLNLDSGQQVSLKAVLREADGTAVEGYTTVWQDSGSGMGSWSDVSAAETVFTAAASGGYGGEGNGIYVQCNGIGKFLHVQINFHTEEFSASATGAVQVHSARQFSIKIYKNDVLQTGPEYEVTWFVDIPETGKGSFLPKKTLPGESTLYTAGTYTGKVKIIASYKYGTHIEEINVVQ